MTDYSILFADAPEAPGSNFQEQNAQKDVEALKSPENAPECEEVPLDNVAGWINERTTAKLERLQATAAIYREGCKEYQDNIKRARGLRERINLEARDGAEPTTLLLLAVECIAAMTGDSYYLDNFKAIREWDTVENAQKAF